MTNGDKIRSMSDEELAYFIDNKIAAANCPPGRKDNPKWYDCNSFESDCERCYLDWLKEETQNAESRLP